MVQGYVVRKHTVGDRTAWDVIFHRLHPVRSVDSDYVEGITVGARQVFFHIALKLTVLAGLDVPPVVLIEVGQAVVDVHASLHLLQIKCKHIVVDLARAGLSAGILYKLMARFTLKLALIECCTIFRLESSSNAICVIDLFFHHRLGEPE